MLLKRWRVHQEYAMSTLQTMTTRKNLTAIKISHPLLAWWGNKINDAIRSETSLEATTSPVTREVKHFQPSYTICRLSPQGEQGEESVTTHNSHFIPAATTFFHLLNPSPSSTPSLHTQRIPTRTPPLSCRDPTDTRHSARTALQHACIERYTSHTRSSTAHSRSQVSGFALSPNLRA